MDSNRLVEQLVENIRRICRDKHISIMQMESDLGFSAGLISRWSKTKTSPSFDKIVDIKDYLNVSFEDLMGNENMPSGASSEKDSDEALPGEIFTQLEKGSTSGMLTWEKAGEDMPFEVGMDVIFPHMLAYGIHRCYYVSYGKGWFLMSVQYSEETADVWIAIYMLTATGIVMEQLELLEQDAMRLLSVVDEEIFNIIIQSMADKMKQDFLKEEY